VLDGLAFIGTFAMLWVGGHILLVGLADLGVTLPYDLVHTLEIPLAGIAVVGGLLAWLVNTLCSMVLGFLVGSLVLGVISLTPLGAKGH
jgi:predicted DNA repair protein MutK